MDVSMIINVLMYALLGWFIYTRFAPIKGLRNLKGTEFAAGLNQGTTKLIDVREPHEFKSGYIPGAVNIPLSQLKNRLGEIPKDRSIFLYCRSGMRSKQAAKILSKNGFSNLAHLQGGIMAWTGKIKK